MLKHMITKPLESMNALPLHAARRMIDAGRRLARERGLAPLGFCILDRGGAIITAQNEDGGTLLRFELAQAKAWTCLGTGHSTRYVKDVMGAQPALLASLAALSAGRVLPQYGGVLVRGVDGELAGAVGVAGAADDVDDEAVALGMIEAGGYVSDLA